MYYLLKTEPSDYSFDDLKREKKTVWEGVTAPAAVKFLRGMNKGDELVIYHTGSERRTVGTATVVKVTADDPKKPLVTIGAGSALKKSLTLEELKQTREFKDSALAKQGRLSVVPLTEAQWKLLVG
jgi:predicted RNA-binding protein with PUA-like domain